MWRLQLIGRPALVGDAGAVIALNRKDAALLALAALEPGISAARTAALLWPEADRRGASNNLRQRLFRIKRAAGASIIQPNTTLRLSCGIDTDCLSDLAHLAQDMHRGDGDLLADADYAVVGDGIATWIESQREAWRARRNARLGELATAFVHKHDPERAVRYARHLVLLDPLSETAHRLLMEVHYARGDRAAAIAAYEHCEAVLHRELRVAPDEPTVQLLHAIESMQPPSALTRPPLRPVALRRPPALIGREGPLQRLADAWHSGLHFILVGEAGLGKTRLLEEFALRTSTGLACRAVVGDHRIPYSLLARLWSAQLAPGLDPAAQRDLWLLSRLGSSDDHAVQRAAAAQAGRVRAALLAAFELLGKAAPRQLLLDDLHFADAASCEMLHGLLPHLRERGWRVGMAHRPGDAWGADASWLAALQEQGHAERHVLAPLTQQDASALVQSLCVHGRDAQLDARLLFQRCGGNPFFMLETLRAWLDDDADDTAVRRAPRAAHVDHLLDARLARLSQQARSLAQVACVAGCDMHVELAASVLERPVVELAGPWHELEVADVLSQERFVHDLVREAVDRSLPQPVRKAFAGRAAAWLAAQGASAARLAYLWGQAARWREAALASEAAARSAHAIGRLAEQAALLQQAADCWQRIDEVAQRNRVLAACATTLEELGRYADAREAALRVINEATGLHDRALGVALLASLRFGEVADDETLRMAREAKGLAVALGNRTLERRMAALEAHTLCWMGHAAEGLELIGPYAATATKPTDDVDTLDFMSWYVDVLRWNGQAENALTLLSALRSQPTATPLPFVWRANALFTEAELANDQAWLERSVACLEQLRDLRCDASGDVAGVTQEDCLLVERLASIGRFREALEIGQRAVAAHREQGHAWLVCAAQVALSLAYSKLGQGAHALTALSGFATEDAGMRMRYEAAVGAAYEALGRPALPSFERALALSPHCEVPTEAAWLIESMLLPHLAAADAAQRADALWHAAKGGLRMKYVLPARVSVMAALRRVGRIDEAVEHAQALMHTFCTTQAGSFATAKTWWSMYLALKAGTRTEEAALAWSQGNAWLARVLPNVPREGRDAFTRGLPAHKDLLAPLS